MDDEQMLKRSTTGAVDPIESEFGTATAAFATAQPRSRRVTWSVVVDVCAVVAVVASVTAVVTSHARHPSDSAANARPMLVPVTAGSLANYRWSVLPAAPFETRGGTVAVWTGQQMIIWGGNSSRLDAVLHADGAAYDPAARTWDSLPPSPLTARASSASVWTGQALDTPPARADHDVQRDPGVLDRHGRRPPQHIRCGR